MFEHLYLCLCDHLKPFWGCELPMYFSSTPYLHGPTTGGASLRRPQVETDSSESPRKYQVVLSLVRGFLSSLYQCLPLPIGLRSLLSKLQPPFSVDTECHPDTQCDLRTGYLVQTSHLVRAAVLEGLLDTGGYFPCPKATYQICVPTPYSTQLIPGKGGLPAGGR